VVTNTYKQHDLVAVGDADEYGMLADTDSHADRSRETPPVNGELQHRDADDCCDEGDDNQLWHRDDPDCPQQRGRQEQKGQCQGQSRTIPAPPAFIGIGFVRQIVPEQFRILCGTDFAAGLVVRDGPQSSIFGR